MFGPASRCSFLLTLKYSAELIIERRGKRGRRRQRGLEINGCEIMAEAVASVAKNTNDGRKERRVHRAVRPHPRWGPARCTP